MFNSRIKTALKIMLEYGFFQDIQTKLRKDFILAISSAETDTAKVAIVDCFNNQIDLLDKLTDIAVTENQTNK